MNRIALAVALALVGCSGGGASDGGSGGGSGGGSTGGGGGSGGGSSGTGGGGSSACPNGDLLTALGKPKLMVGGSFDDPVDPMASWDLRYLYLSGGLFDGATPCASCANSCSSNGQSCANGGPGCVWWGCYQYDQNPPGEYVRDFVSAAKARGEIPMFSYYEVLQAGMVAEGTAEIDKLNDSAFLTRYLNDWRFVLQQIGADKALLHIEPDLWGYGMQKNADPHASPAAVQSANPTDCASEENSLAGFGKCMVAMVHKYAPNAKVALHASAWATGADVSLNTDPSFDVVGAANTLGDFLKACGASDADYLVVETSDRDAAWYQMVRGENRWWDKTNATLPDFTQHFTWAKALSERVGRPLLWWQMPVGNETLNNTTNHYQDNRLDYFFDHMVEVAQAHGFGVAYGAGDGDQTNPSTDMGHLVARVGAYKDGGQSPCP